MSKFKVGDRVVGNAKASKRYAITTEGWRGTVVSIGFDTTIRVEGPDRKGVNTVFPVCDEYFDLVREGNKVVITTDGKTTTAKLYENKKVVKSAEAKCSTDDVFDFGTGAALALSRLLVKKAEPEKRFPKEELVDGRFGCKGADHWFVVVAGCLVYESGGYDRVSSFDDEGVSIEPINVIVEAKSFNHARSVVKKRNHGRVIWSRPGFVFE